MNIQTSSSSPALRIGRVVIFFLIIWLGFFPSPAKSGGMNRPFSISEQVRKATVGGSSLSNRTLQDQSPSSGGPFWIRSVAEVDQSEYYPTSVVPLPDGGAIFVLSAWFTGESDSLRWIIRVDTNGQTIWQKVYRFGEFGEYLVDAEMTADGNILISGFGNEAVLMKIDLNGNVLWHGLYPAGGAFTGFYAIAETDDGGIIAVGLAATGHHGWIVRMDAAGAILWEKTYGFKDFFDIVVTDGGYLVTDSEDYLLKIDDDGDVVWQKKFSSPAIYRIHAMNATSAGEILLTGSVEPAVHSDLWVVKLSGDGEILWQKQFDFFEDDEGRAIQEMPDGKILVAGWGETDGWLLLIDADGGVLWARSFPEIQIYRLGIGSENSLILIGTNSWTSPVVLYLMRLDPNGSIIGCGAIQNADVTGISTEFGLSPASQVGEDRETTPKTVELLPENTAVEFETICSQPEYEVDLFLPLVLQN